jgi:hypothetical protein
MKLRARGQILPIVLVVLVVLVTLANAAANVLTAHPVNAAAMRAAALEPVIARRQLRIAALRGVNAGCSAEHSRELVRLLVQDGRWSDARDIADRYEQRCGTDPVVHRWRNAPQPKRLQLADRGH